MINKALPRNLLDVEDCQKNLPTVDWNDKFQSLELGAALTDHNH